MRTSDSVFSRIDSQTAGTKTYGAALTSLKGLPIGYTLCFAFHYVNADLVNGGISQLYANPTWALTPTAVRACGRAGCHRLEHLLKEIIYYYHQRDRSKLKRQLTEDYFDDVSKPMIKSLSQLEDEYFSLGAERQSVVEKLVAVSAEELWGAT